MLNLSPSAAYYRSRAGAELLSFHLLAVFLPCEPLAVFGRLFF